MTILPPSIWMVVAIQRRKPGRDPDALLVGSQRDRKRAGQAAAATEGDGRTETAADRAATDRAGGNGARRRPASAQQPCRPSPSSAPTSPTRFPGWRSRSPWSRRWRWWGCCSPCSATRTRPAPPCCSAPTWRPSSRPEPRCSSATASARSRSRAVIPSAICVDDRWSSSAACVALVAIPLTAGSIQVALDQLLAAKAQPIAEAWASQNRWLRHDAERHRRRPGRHRTRIPARRRPRGPARRAQRQGPERRGTSPCAWSSAAAWSAPRRASVHPVRRVGLQ